MTSQLRAFLLFPAALALSACPAPDTLNMLPKPPDGGEPTLNAFGHGPSWKLRMDRKDWRLTSTEAGWDRAGKTPRGVRMANGGWRYGAEALTVSIPFGTCRDALTSQRYFYSVSIKIEGRTLAGCAGPQLPREDLDGTAWRGIKQLPESGDYIMRTFEGSMRFEDGRVTGSTGCNRFSADYRVENEMLLAGPVAVTRMACSGVKATFERQFLSLLAEPAQIGFLPTGGMTLTRRDGLYDYVFLSFEPDD